MFTLTTIRMRPLPEAIVTNITKLSRGQVWCKECGHTEKVDPKKALAHGWPNHCGYTMTIDSPEEQDLFTQHNSEV